MAQCLYPLVVVFSFLLAAGCVPSSGSGEHLAESLAGAQASQLPAEAETLAVEQPPVTGIVRAADQGLPPELRDLDTTWTGDFDGMQERRVVRVLTSFAKGL